MWARGLLECLARLSCKLTCTCMENWNIPVHCSYTQFSLQVLTSADLSKKRSVIAVYLTETRKLLWGTLPIPLDRSEKQCCSQQAIR